MISKSFFFYLTSSISKKLKVVRRQEDFSTGERLQAPQEEATEQASIAAENGDSMVEMQKTHRTCKGRLIPIEGMATRSGRGQVNAVPRPACRCSPAIGIYTKGKSTCNVAFITWTYYGTGKPSSSSHEKPRDDTRVPRPLVGGLTREGEEAASEISQSRPRLQRRLQGLSYSRSPLFLVFLVR